MLTRDLGSLLRDPAMQLGDVVTPAVGSFDDRLAAAIAAAVSENDVKRLGVTPEEIAATLLTVAQGARYLSNALAESREEFVGRLAAAVHVLLAGIGDAAKATR
jgi:hypothetical protein